MTKPQLSVTSARTTVASAARERLNTARTSATNPPAAAMHPTNIAPSSAYTLPAD